MPRLLAAVLALCATPALAQAVDATKPPAGFVPPVLKGVKGNGVPRHAEGPIPFPDAREEWIAARSRHFTFVSSAGERRTREMAANLETLAAALSRLSPRFTAAAAPTRVIVFSRRRESQPYFDMLLNREHSTVTGVFVSQRGGGAMIINDSAGLPSSERTPYHELVHYLIANGEARPPLWLEEGLAEYFANAELRSKAIYAGAPVHAHILALQRRFMPLEQLFAVERESDAYNLPDGQTLFYAESWAVVDWLFRNGGKERAAFYAFLADLEHGVAPAVALRERYHSSPEEVRASIAAYVPGSSNWWNLRIAVPDTDTTVTTAPLSRAALLYELGRFLAGIEGMAPEAERHFRAALDADPRHARSLAALAVLRAGDRRDAEAAPLFDQALAADPKDADIALDYAESLLGTEIGALAGSTEIAASDVPRFRQARALAQRALDLGGDRPRALAIAGTSYLIESDAGLAPALAALEEAHALAPGRTDIAVHLFEVYRRLGDRAKAGALFAQLDAKKIPQVAYATRAIMLRVGMARANALLKDQKLVEASAVMRELAAESSADADSAADLERQAREIDRVAQQNREIGMYNQAIRALNGHDYGAARRTIDELLATARDPGVIADARKLRDQLARVRR
jgi:tetratricopeptide (TPR) repeat protein